VCEAAFSKMKYLKNEYRNELRLMIFSEMPDFTKLSACMQDQDSQSLIAAMPRKMLLNKSIKMFAVLSLDFCRLKLINEI